MGQEDGGNKWRHALAGGTAGLTTSLVLHPLDVVKTRMQVQDGAGLLPAYRGTVDALRQIVREEGWRALYSGLTPALAGSGLAWSIYFYAYNRAKQRYQRLQLRASSAHGGGGQAGEQAARLSPGMHLVSAAEAGAVVCLLTNPVWVVKTRLQLQRRTLQQAAAAAKATGGAAAAGAAGPAAAAGAAAGAASRAAASAAAAAASNGAQVAPVAAGAAAGARAAAAGTLAAAAAIPRRLLGTAAAAAPAESCAVEYRGFLHAFVQIARCEGIRGLYRGLLPSLLLVSHGAIQFAVYEELKSAAQHISLDRFTHPLGSSSSSSSSSSSRSAAGGTGRAGGSSSGGPGLFGGPARELSPAEITAFGALSKLAASVATYPSQVLRSRLQQRMDSRALQYTGVADVVRKTLQREGVGGFYKGLVPNVLRVMPQSALTFLVYESVMRLLSDQRRQGRAAA